jgi:hypothetical protein
MIDVRCDKCNAPITGLDDVMLIRYDTIGVYGIKNLTRSASVLLNDGENAMLCEKCGRAFKEFLALNTDDIFERS